MTGAAALRPADTLTGRGLGPGRAASNPRDDPISAIAALIDQRLARPAALRARLAIARSGHTSSCHFIAAIGGPPGHAAESALVLPIQASVPFPIGGWRA